MASYSVGVNQIDRAAAAAPQHLRHAHARTSLTDATADLTIALLLALARRIVEGDRMVRTGRFAGWAPDLLLGRDLKGKVFGIVGPGRIGRAVARRAKAFGMSVIATGPKPADRGRSRRPAARLLRRAAAALGRRVAPRAV